MGSGIDLTGNRFGKLIVIRREENDKYKYIGEFLDWMIDETTYRVCNCDAYDEYQMSSHSERENLLAEYFNIDLDKVEQERRKLLKWLQEAHNESN